MRTGIGIAAGIVGFALYGALYFMVFSHLFQDSELAIRMTVIGMLLSGISFLAGFHILGGDGMILFAKALALPLIGTAALLVVAIFLTLVSNHITDIAILGLGGAITALYALITWIFFPVR